MTKTSIPLSIPLTVRELTLEDLPALEWSGGTSHLQHVAEHLALALEGRCQVLGVELPTGLIIAKGGVQYAGIIDPLPAGTTEDTVAVLWMLSVRESWQSLGVGTLLIAGLEDAARTRGRTTAMIGVEHDNPRALALYRRLGYTGYASALGGWPVGAHRRYVTVVSHLCKAL